jgi:hypothetical protein
MPQGHKTSDNCTRAGNGGRRTHGGGSGISNAERLRLIRKDSERCRPRELDPEFWKSKPGSQQTESVTPTTARS